MKAGDSNTSHNFFNGLKWLVNSAIALLVASGSVVAILQYINQPGPSLTAAPVFITPVVVTSTPWSDRTAPQTHILPTIIYDTTLAMHDSIDFVYSYWQNVSDGKYENAWMQLSPGFRQDGHNNDYNNYVSGYQKMNLCHLAVSNVNLI